MRKESSMFEYGMHEVVRQSQCGKPITAGKRFQLLRIALASLAGFCLLPLVAEAQPFVIAEAFADGCDYSAALTHWAQEPAEDRESFDGRLLKARLLIQLDRGREAIAELEPLQKTASESRTAEVLLALGLAQSSARLFTDSEKTLKAARQKGADADLIDAGIAELRLSAGKFKESEILLRQVLRRSPTLVGPILNLAVLRVREHNVAEAVALIRSAWQLGYRNPRELQTSVDFMPLRVLGLIDDLIASTEGARCAIH